MSQTSTSQDNVTTQAIDIAIRLGVVFLLAMWCLQILTPFISVIVWGGIIAIAIYTPFLKLTEKLGGNKKRAATLISLGTIAAILVPTIVLSGSLVESATTLGTHIFDGTLTIPAPSESVSSWPLVGDKIYNLWEASSVNLSAVLQEYPEQVKHIGVTLLGLATGVGLGVLQFVISMIIAGVFLTSCDAITPAMLRLAKRLNNNQGQYLLALGTGTVRSVAVGVLGIAVIQGIMAGVGMILVGVPGAGLLALVVLVVAIAQLPSLLILGPVSFYVFSVADPTVAIVFLVWSVLINFTDVVLKPFLLGRGLDIPMIVILLGAIGGMIMSGIVGLFIGAIILGLGYKLFQTWVERDELEMNESSIEQVK